MSLSQAVVLVVAITLTVGGMALVLKREIGSTESRRLVGPLRDAIELAIPAAGVVLLVWWTWTAVR